MHLVITLDIVTIGISLMPIFLIVFEIHCQMDPPKQVEHICSFMNLKSLDSNISIEMQQLNLIYILCGLFGKV